MLDIVMPDLNGIEVLKIIRKDYKQIDLPIIMVTAKDDDEDIITSLELGANDYFTKPINIKKAKSKMR